MKARLLMTAVGLVLLAGCSSAGPRPVTEQSAPPAPAPQRTLTMAIRLEPASLSLRPPKETFSNVDHTRIFNADFAIVNDQASPIPYLAEVLPQLNSNDWQVQPDGRMQTTYHLRPNLTWQDGTPLNAEDFVFGNRVYSTPEVGLALQPPFVAIEQVQAPDARTVVIRWKRLYPDAGHMAGRDRNLPALPRHLLETAFGGESTEGFLAHGYWSREFLGLGPYRVAGWEPGSFIDATAFEGHALGRPRMDRLKIMFIPDANTALANMLSGEVEFASGTTLRVTNSFTLRQEWEPKQGGTVFYQIYTWHGLVVQFLPGLTSPRSLLDARMRRALAHSIDRSAINEAINGGIAQEADYYLPPNSQWGSEVQRGAVKHGYDLQLTDQLMREMGYSKGADGVYASLTDGPFALELMAGTTDSVEAPAIANDWEKAGFRISQRLIPPALALDQQTKLGFPAVAITTQPATERTVVAPVPGNIPTPDNGWRGGSQISWTNPEYTRLVEQFTSTLDRSQRGEQMAQMAHVFSTDLGAISTHFPPLVWAMAAKVTGPHEGPPETNVFWNIHTWELR